MGFLEYENPAGTQSSMSLLDLRKPGRGYSKRIWGVHWLSLASMIGMFMSGVLFAVSHHLYYNSFDGEPVPPVPTDDGFGLHQLNSQQWTSRFGNAFAFLSKFCLCAAVASAYTQWLWKTMREKSLTVNAIDMASLADSNLYWLLSPEILLNVKLGSVLALIAWLIPLSALVTPGTLNVEMQLRNTNAMMNVPSVDINSAHNASRYAYYQWADLVGDYEFIGPTSALSRMFGATASSAEILPIRPPYVNSSYTLSFYGPCVKCQDAPAGINDTIVGLTTYSALNNTIGMDLIKGQTSINKDQSGWVISYNAFVPYLAGNTMRASYLDSQGGATSAGSNSIWFYVLRFPQWAPDIEELLVCDLYNASYSVDFKFVENQPQELTVTKIETTNSVEYNATIHVVPTSSAPSHMTNSLDEIPEFNQANLSYSAYMQQFQQQLKGYIARYGQGSSHNMANIVTTSVLSTALGGSTELQNYLRQVSNPDQLDLDVGMARNRTIKELIEELAVNSTLSMMSEGFVDRFGPKDPHQANVTMVLPVNVYNYRPLYLVVSYSITILLALFGILVGGIAYHSNGVAHDFSFSSVVCTTRNSDLDELVQGQGLGSLPHDKEFMNTKLRFGKLRSKKWVDENGQTVAHAAFGRSTEVDEMHKLDICN